MCCGRRRVQYSPIIPSRTAAPAGSGRHSGSMFEYTGRTALTVTGPVTGARYRFEGPNSRLQIDPRDSNGLAHIPVLRLVS